MVGYREAARRDELIERRAIAGLFLVLAGLDLLPRLPGWAPLALLVLLVAAFAWAAFGLTGVGR